MPPFALVIIDGFAVNPNPNSNAVAMAKKPNLDRLFADNPYTELVTFGERVGLPGDQMGNSEVGHLNIGAGRVVEQDLLRIDRAAKNKSFSESPAFLDAVAKSSVEGKALHLLGLCSTGGVHSSIEHLKSMIEAALLAGSKRVYVHAITDGRDRPQTASLEEVKDLEDFIASLRTRFPESQIAIVDLIGRYYAMDRDKRWDRTELAFNLYTKGLGEAAPSAIEAIQSQIALGLTDEFYKPVALELPVGYRSGKIESGDVLICFNFRADRMRQIVAAFLGSKINFSNFEIGEAPQLAGLVTLTEYEEGLPVEILFPQIQIKNYLGEVISKSGLKQLRLAETEKYPHVTYFFNGGVEEPSEGEERALVPSPRDVPTYDKKPEMSAAGVTEILLDRLPMLDFFVVNYANCDMVGHTGDIAAAIKAVETVDTCIGKIVEKISALGGTIILTADHGNADQMVDYQSGQPHTFHTKYPVPFCIIGPLMKGKTLKNGGALCDIAPTILDLLGIEKPKEMTGQSLIGDVTL